MSRDIWNPQQYRAYASHRARPFFELLSRVDVTAPAYVVDLGCGPGERTADLAARWPAAVIEGIDSSQQMIAEARRTVRARPAPRQAAAGPKLTDADADADAGAVQVARAAPPQASAGDVGDYGDRDDLDRLGDSSDLGSGLRFSVGDLAAWVPERPVDVIFSNAALQWVPGHQRLLPGWVEALAPGGRLAFSMPGNFDGPSHRLLRELCHSARWRDRLGEVNRHNVVDDPADYFELLSDLGCDVDAWETTYLQVLQGTDPVLEWMKGTALRPALDALPEEGEREEFLAELTLLIREAYPPGPHGTLFPFRRIFVVAGQPGTAPSAPRSA
jgi:trans-aconitate 2-methyltransferase